MAITILDEMSNEAILTEIGNRLRESRLRLPIPMKQSEVALKAGIALSTIQNLEKGGGTLATLIAVLRALDLLDQLNNVLPPLSISPLMMLKQSKPRQRARVKKSIETNE